MIQDFLNISVERVKHKKLRSMLTVLGIIIGVSLVVVLTSLSQGMQEAINGQFSALGFNVIIIEPGSGFITSISGPSKSIILDKSDLDIIEHSKGVDDAAGVIISSSQVKFKGQTMFTMVRGMPTDTSKQNLLKDTFARIENGNSFVPGSDDTALIGYSLATDDSIFDNPASLGDKMEIAGQQFKIVGQIKKIGEPTPDNLVAIPLDTARKLFNKPDEFNMMMARVSSGYEPDEVAANIENALRRHRNVKVDEEDFKVTTSQQLVESFKSVLLVVNIVVIAIAMISILVGGINIMNTMYTSVLERTREIGVMKSIGARNSHIMLLFIVESSLYGLAGGLIGTGIGISFAKTIEAVIAPKLAIGFFAASISPWIIFGSILFSMLIGVLSGLVPARKASRLNPVEAIRYE